MPPLTPHERVEALIDAFVRHQHLAGAAEMLRQRLNQKAIRTARREMIVGRLDDRLDAENRAAKEIVAHVKILMSDGILERCAEMLKIETPPAATGRP
ncbi:MAG: hypothetical protein COC12_12040 [Rhodobacteraceae bacterium]|nr:MAG: hypothetical protein COC12_12040 [Paracoccaceae bacterium]